MRRAASLVPDLYAVDADYALSELCKDEQKLEKVLLGREFHVSLGRTVGIQVHQIDSLVAMLRQKFQSQQRYWMEFNKWEHFVNDDSTRSFLSLEVTRTGLPEVCGSVCLHLLSIRITRLSICIYLFWSYGQLILSFLSTLYDKELTL
uniref:U6 snRNA phosphodiesterase 1 n=1 Tax=Aegilops tauschii subsp. strangulata TaxID=200361 RepID=A0A453P6Y4_AEGTS